MPHFGQRPGSCAITSGCIGQVYSTRSFVSVVVAVAVGVAVLVGVLVPVPVGVAVAVLVVFAPIPFS
jgi:hypothetical protein